MDSGQLFKKIGLVSLGVFAIACTRAQDQVSTLRMQLPQTMKSSKVGAAAVGDPLIHVTVNIYGDGIQAPIVKNWDRCHECGPAGAEINAADLYIENVPGGSNRTVQVLAVYSDSTGGMSFYYGAAAGVAMTSAEATATVTLASISSGQQADGAVAGRYLTAANSGPTGTIAIRYNPGTGDPAMVIERSPIFNGWFSFFALSSTNFEYVLEDGTNPGMKLFDGAVNLDDSRFKPVASDYQKLRVSIPSHQRSNNGVWKAETPNVVVLGYFSPDSSLISGKSICRDFTGSLTRMARASNQATMLTMGTPNGAIPTVTELFKTDATSLTTIAINGGRVSTDGNCTSATDFLDKLAISTSMLDGNGKDGAIPFRGFFRQESNGGGYSAFKFNGNADPKTLGARFLPGYESLVNQVRLFKKVNSNLEWMDAPSCDNIADTAKSGFSDGGTATAISADGSFTMNTNITATDISGSVVGVLCPVKDGQIRKIGTFISRWNFNNGGGGGGPYLQIGINGGVYNGMTHHLTAGVCYPASFGLYTSSIGGVSNPYSLDPSSTLTISNVGSVTWGQFYSSSDCSSGVVSGDLTIAPEMSQVSGSLYFKPNTTGLKTFAGITISGVSTISFTPATSPIDVHSPILQADGLPNEMIYGDIAQCYSVQVSRQEYGGYPISSDSTALTVSYDYTAGSYALYPTVTDCRNSTAQMVSGVMTIGSYSPTVGLAIKRLNTTASGISIGFTAASFSGALWTATGVSDSAVGSRFKVIASGSAAYGACNGIDVIHVNANDKEVPIITGTSVNLAGVVPGTTGPLNEVQFFSDASCNSTLGGNIVGFSQGESRKKVYMSGSLTSGFGAISIIATGSSISGVSGSINFVPPSGAQANIPYLTFQYPKIKSILLGSHDFPKTITFTPSASSTISCKMATSPSYNFSSGSSCDSSISSNTFTWSVADATAATPVGFEFTVNNSYGFKRYVFIPEYLYSMSGNNFKVKTCGATLATGSTYSDIATALGSNAVVCLDAGSFGGSGTTPISLANQYIIGKTDANGNLTSHLGAQANNTIFDSNSGTNFLANMELAQAGSGTPAPLVNVSGSSGSFYSSNNLYTVGAYHYKAIAKASPGTMGVISVRDTFDLDGSTSTVAGIYYGCGSTCGSTQQILSPMFKLQSGASGSQISRGIYIYNSTISALTIQQPRLDLTANNGSFITSDETGYSAGIAITDANMRFAGAANSNRFPFFLNSGSGGGNTLNINNSLFVNAMAEELIKGNAGSANLVTLAINKSRLVSEVDNRIIFMNSGFAQSISTDETHFVRVGGGGCTYPTVASGGAQNWTLSGVGAKATTYFCGISGGTNFSSTAQYSPGGNFSSFSPQVTNTANVSDLTCQ